MSKTPKIVQTAAKLVDGRKWRGRKTDERLVQAADRLFRITGRSDFTGATLSAEAGVVKRTIYDRFVTLDAVKMTACSHWLDELKQYVEARPSGDSVGAMAVVIDCVCAPGHRGYVQYLYDGLNDALGRQSLYQKFAAIVEDTVYQNRDGLRVNYEEGHVLARGYVSFILGIALQNDVAMIDPGRLAELVVRGIEAR